MMALMLWSMYVALNSYFIETVQADSVQVRPSHTLWWWLCCLIMHTVRDYVCRNAAVVVIHDGRHDHPSGSQRC